MTDQKRKNGSNRKRKRASLAGIFARECIRRAMGLSKLKNGGLLTLGRKYAQTVSRWKSPNGSRFEKFNVNGVPMELLDLKKGGGEKVILHFHGGAYLIKFMDLYRKIALRYAKISKWAVLSVDYRIAPEHRFPAALEDAFAAWMWLMNHGYQAENIIVAGDSAGGNLALALTLKLRDEGRALPGALILMSPWADMSSSGETHRSNFNKDPLFGECAGDQRAEHLRAPGNPYAGDADLKDPYLSPVYARYENFPPMLIQVGDWEMLLSDARTVAQKARDAGVSVTLTEYPDMFHCFQVFCPLLPESRRAWKEARDFIFKNFQE